MGVALVTGSRQGLGRVVVEGLLEDGWTVHGCSREAPSWARDGYTHHVCDVTDALAVVRLVRAIRALGRLDAVVNNAGCARMNSALLVPVSDMRHTFDVNVVGTMLVCREAAKVMAQQESGRIVNVTTVAVPLRLEGEAVYVAAKAAVEAYTRVLAREVARLGITVNAVGPGPVTGTGLMAGVPAATQAALVARLAPPRANTGEDVWRTVRWLLSDDARAVTGQVVYLGGVG